ncbi:response regulator [bacterium]|nr:response regulator [bacterium]
MNILYVEDSLTLVRLVQNFLENKGIKVFSSDNVDEALKILDAQRIDFILSDIILRGTIKTGYILVRELRKNENTKNIPIYLTSTRDARAATITAIKIGAKGFLKKPFELQELYEIIIKEINESS